MSLRAACLLVPSVLGVACAQQVEQMQQAEPIVVEAGALRCEIHVSRTAHLFHVVDQISAWDQYCHGQYRRAMTSAAAFTPDDEAMLARHVEVRKARGWGRGLEQTFYSPLDLDAALAQGVQQGNLTAAEADVERAVFAHFAARIEALLAEERPRLERFAAALAADRARLAAFADKLAAFVGVPQVTVPAFLIANPDDRNFGGGYNGGRLTLEVPRAFDALPTFLHEVMHAFLAVREPELRKAIAVDPSLDWQTFNEGITHALAPGLYRPEGDVDVLQREVGQDFARGLRFADGPVRFRFYALTLRPLLAQALEQKATIDAFVPRALDAWKVAQEIAAMRAAARPR
jgi:hypothetical protein